MKVLVRLRSFNSIDVSGEEDDQAPARHEDELREHAWVDEMSKRTETLLVLYARSVHRQNLVGLSERVFRQAFC